MTFNNNTNYNVMINRIRTVRVRIFILYYYFFLKKCRAPAHISRRIYSISLFISAATTTIRNEYNIALSNRMILNILNSVRIECQT